MELSMIFDMVQDWITIATYCVTFASVVASMTATPKDDLWVGRAYKVIDIIALNVGRAKDRR